MRSSRSKSGSPRQLAAAPVSGDGRRENFPALTGIRGLAMYMVFIQHYDPFSPSDAGGYAVRFINEFYVALIMFFVLSGFLITYRYYDRPEVSLRTYLVNRVARVYPMYFLVTAITFIISPSGSMYLAGELSPWMVFVANITFVRGFFSDLLFSGVAQGWSLTPEEMFYLSAPVAFVLFRRSLWSLVLLPLALLGIGFLLVDAFGGGGSHGFMADEQFMRVYTFFGLSATFYAGAGMAIAWMRYRDRIKGRGFTWLGGGVILTYMVACTVLKGAIPFAVQHPLAYAASMTLLPTLGFAALLWGLMTETTWLSRFLGTKAMVALGESSLSFYLIHMGVLSGWLSTLTQSVLLICVVATALGLVLNRLVERPLDRWIRRAAGTRKPQND